VGEIRSDFEFRTPLKTIHRILSLTADGMLLILKLYRQTDRQTDMASKFEAVRMDR
jgi:hypothetical protein